MIFRCIDTNKKDLELDKNMVDMLRGLQASFMKLATASEKQTVASEKQAAAIESLRDDIFLNTVDPNVGDDEHVGSENATSLDIKNALAKVLPTTSVAVSDKKRRRTLLYLTQVLRASFWKA